MQSFAQIEYTVRSPLAIISLNRPAVRNAVSLSMTTELDEAFKLAVRDHEVRVIVLRANGANFSSGHDLGSDLQISDLQNRNFPPGPMGDVENWSECDTEMCLRWRQIPKPIVCGVKGYTIYHGTALLAIADVALAADDLRYMPSLIEYNSLPWETGLSVKRSKEILFLQRFVLAEEAASLGIVNRVVPAASLDTELLRLAHQMARTDPMHLRMMKSMVNQAQDAAGIEGFARAGLSHWAAWRWHWSQSNAAKTKDQGGSAKTLAPVKEALSGDAWDLALEASGRKKSKL
jgi:enoyl-CoA hydratase/carnithine racemase